MEPAVWKKWQSLRDELSVVRRVRKALPARSMILALGITYPQPETIHLLARGNPHAPEEEVAPRFPELFETALPEIPGSSSEDKKPLRRKVLADWIASGENRLTSRVMVNRLWQHHFGRGIVRSANNFGQLGTAPTHPELLNWLAFRFIENGWHIKPIHRMMVLSNTYRMSSRANPEGLAADPENNLFWRFDPRRLSAEEIRDSILAVSGKLNRKVYGPSIYPNLSQEVLATQSDPGRDWGKSTAEERSRRSIYIHVKRSLLTPQLSNFDFPDPDSSCEARFITTQPAQALGMLHAEFLHEQSGFLADRVVRVAQSSDLDMQIQTAIRLVLGREATEDDLEDAKSLIEKLKTKHQKDAKEALRYYCLSLLNLNEFVYLD